MIDKQNSARRQELVRQVLVLQLIGAPGAVCLALGVLGYVSEPEGVLAFLNVAGYRMALLAVGAFLMGLETIKIIPVIKELAALAEVERRGGGE